MSATSLPVIADGPAGPVGDFGGRSIDAREIRILDVSLPALCRVERATLRSTIQRLSGADVSLDPYGFAFTEDGAIWVLAGKGRFLLRFSERTGKLVEKRALADPGQGLAGLWGRVGLVAVRVRPGEPLLLRLESAGFLRFSRLVSRSAPEITALLIRNLLRCGSGTQDAIPCWYTAGPAEVLLLAPDGTARAIEVPSFALPSRSRASSRDPGIAFTYPVRDAFLSDDGLWVLTNQEGDRTPLEEGARRGRHVVLLRERRPKKVALLDREARAILDAGEHGLVLLFADGTIGRVAGP